MQFLLKCALTYSPTKKSPKQLFTGVRVKRLTTPLRAPVYGAYAFEICSALTKFTAETDLHMDQFGSIS